MELVWLSFITGLTSGGISCIAIQGGLLTSAVSDIPDKNDTKTHVLSFVVSKLITYTLFGFLLGVVGSFLTLSPKVSAIFQIFIGLYLLATAGRILNLHPIFRYVVFQPPKFIYKFAKSQSKKGSLFTPIFLGALTVLMPCGVTQAMMAVALSTANPVSSALIMFAFVLGTSPVFFTLGISISKLIKYRAFNLISASVITVFALISINGAFGLMGSPHTFQNYWKVITQKNNVYNTKNASLENGYQNVTIYVTNSGYESDTTTLKTGIPVRLKILTDNVFSCSRAFVIPEFNISRILPATGEEIIEFTPNRTGRLAYSCSMGMYTGSFNVVE